VVYAAARLITGTRFFERNFVTKNSWKYNIAVIAMGFIMIGHQTGQSKQRYSYASNSQLAMKTKETKSTNAHSNEPTVLQKVQTCCSVLELRQYTLHPGRRDVLIELFDREFIESQEALGMTIVGQFRDLEQPNRFVWLRGFADMTSRARALEGFYGGPVWKANREAANATMIDSDNVLLLRPARPGSGFSIKNDRPRPGAEENVNNKGLIVATIYYFDQPVTEEFLGFFEGTVRPVLADAGASILAYFVTEPSKNNFPRLPVREGENVFVWFSSFRDERAHADHQARLSGSQRWLGEVSQKLARWLKRNPEVLRLSPTRRSRLRA
jgi:hypothetical protein